jgi:hypothetical protein
VIELGWGLLALICLAAALAWFWQDSLAARERANKAALEACERLSLQFLDGTVAFARLAPMRQRDGWLGLRRTYIFDYTANSIERRQGFVILSRHRIESVGFAPGDEGRPARAETAAAPAAPEPAKVLDLNDWRSRQTRSGPAGERRESDRDELP